MRITASIQRVQAVSQSSSNNEYAPIRSLELSHDDYTSFCDVNKSQQHVQRVSMRNLGFLLRSNVVNIIGYNSTQIYL